MKGIILFILCVIIFFCIYRILFAKEFITVQNSHYKEMIIDKDNRHDIKLAENNKGKNIYLSFLNKKKELSPEDFWSDKNNEPMPIIEPIKHKIPLRERVLGDLFAGRILIGLTIIGCLSNLIYRKGTENNNKI